jgi:DNA-binding response OmpR family regulator
MEPYRLLIVEDEPSIGEALVEVCAYKGYASKLCRTGEEGLNEALIGGYDLVLLDLMLPGMDGFTVCNRIRERNAELPIIILTAKTSEQDIIDGLRFGADDYVSKLSASGQAPIGPLFARIEAVLRRSKRRQESDQQMVVGKWTIHFKDRTGRNGESEQPFTVKEIELLEYLWKHSHRPVSRQELLKEVWDYENADAVDTRTVDIHITKIRKKIEPNPAAPRHLVTLRGEGYQLLCENDDLR